MVTCENLRTWEAELVTSWYQKTHLMTVLYEMVEHPLMTTGLMYAVMAVGLDL